MVCGKNYLFTMCNHYHLIPCCPLPTYSNPDPEIKSTGKILTNHSVKLTTCAPTLWQLNPTCLKIGVDVTQYRHDEEREK